MHFGIKGQADRWWKKNRFSVYLMPTICAGTLMMMCGMLIFIFRESGPLPDDFNLVLWFFTFSLTYLLYKTQTGIIQYSLKKVKNLWPAMGMGLSLVAVSSILLSVLPFIPTKPAIFRAVMCAKIESRKPADIRTAFSMNDGSAILFLNLRNIKGQHLIRMEWINPEGKEHYVNERSTHHKIFAKHYPWWSYIYIKDNIKNIIPGNWRVDVFIDREKVLTQSFTII
jgi:hypothetical protein